MTQSERPAPPQAAPELREEAQANPKSQPLRSGNGFNNLNDGNAVQTKQDAMSKLSCNDLLCGLY